MGGAPQKRSVVQLLLALCLCALGACSVGTSAPASTGNDLTRTTTEAPPASPPASSVGVGSTMTTIVGDSAVTSQPPRVGSDPEVSPDDLVWTAVAVEDDDVLNVRQDADPGAPILDELAPWSTAFSVTSEMEVNDTGTWRRIQVGDDTRGWVNARFLVAQPEVLTLEHERQMVAMAEEVVSWALDGEGAPDTWLADRALWVGGIGIYADAPTPWTWIPAARLQARSEWNQPRIFDLGFPGSECGSECIVSLVDFLKFRDLDETARYLVDDIPSQNARGFIDGKLRLAPEFLHRVVIDKPETPEGNLTDWQRIHLVFDWSSGEPRVALIHTHGWTP